MDTIHADLQTTLHNAWFRGKEHPSAFKREDFLSDGKQALPETNWKAQRLVLRGIFEGQGMRKNG